MASAFRRLALGLGLIALSAGALLLSDLDRRTTRRTHVPRIALFPWSSRPVLDDAVRGAVEELAARGFVDGHGAEIVRMNPEADSATAASMTRAIAGGGFDVAVSFGTLALQSLATANRDGRVPHVFCAVTDPAGAGVGISKGSPLAHPRWLAGVGTFQPVKQAFRLARRMNPGLKRVGTVWCPCESNSEACVRQAREICAELGIELLEATVDSTTGVAEAARALVSRGVEAIWLGGDNTVETADAALVAVAKQGRIPVFANAPGHASVGALFGLGADYVEVGRRAGSLAADVLSGGSLAAVRVEDVMPESLALNRGALAGLLPGWSIPPDVKESAPAGPPAAAAPGAGAAPLAKRWKLRVVQLVDGPAIAESRAGILAGLAEAGLREGRDYELKVADAQGDLSLLPALLDAAVTDDAGMILTITTPALEAALQKVKDRPIVFALSLDPLLVGDPGTHERHRPNVAGVYDRSPFEEMLALVRELLPSGRSVGTLYAPSERNSVVFRDEMTRVAGRLGLSVVAVPSASTSEVSEAALALTGRGVDAIVQINDNQNEAGWDAIVSAARRAKIPLFSFNSVLARRGAAVALANDHRDGGREAALLAARILRGESPASLPYRGVARKRLAVNPAAARETGLGELPASLLARADEVVGAAAPASAPASTSARALPPGRRYRVAVVGYMESSMLDDALRGLRAELPRQGLVEGRNLELRVSNAQGDMASLSSLVDSAASWADLVCVTSSPTLQAAIRRIPSAPVVFNVVADPVAAGAGKSFADHAPNVTGISTLTDFEGMARLVSECLPRARRVGTLFNPGEVNSVVNRDAMTAALKARRIELVSLPTSTPAEVSDAALALAARGLDAICQVNGNLHDAAFSGIAEAARKSRLPLFAFTSAQAKGGGAAAAVARDYERAGEDEARLVARVLAGESPKGIPFQLVSRTVLVLNPAAAAAQGLTFPPAVLARADEVVK